DRIVVMKDGVVQQIGAPPEVYAQPANLHVARFMGYRNGLALDVGPHGGARTRASVAIRPEEIVVVNGGGAANIISGRIDNVEYGGRDALLDIVTPSGTLIHARGPVTLKRGEDVSVH